MESCFLPLSCVLLDCLELDGHVGLFAPFDRRGLLAFWSPYPASELQTDVSRSSSFWFAFEWMGLRDHNLSILWVSREEPRKSQKGNHNGKASFWLLIDRYASHSFTLLLVASLHLNSVQRTLTGTKTIQTKTIQTSVLPPDSFGSQIQLRLTWWETGKSLKRNWFPH